MFKRTLLGAAVAAAVFATQGGQAASLTIFHNNDGESKLFGDTNFGGAAYFTTTLNNARAAKAARDQLTLSSGDNFLAGLAFNASLATGPVGSRTYFDALALVEINYDAITFGNHDFDFGPEVLADFVSFYDAQGGGAKFLSANLDFSGEASLDALVTSGNIAKSTTITRGSETYGIIGVTTTDLDIVSNPGAVTAGNVLSAIQTEVTALQGSGVDKIILSSHLQSIANELDLVSQLSGVDVVIAGGGDELLINADNARNTLAQATGPYPVIRQDSDGKNVAVVTTVGEYFYVGALDVEFDTNGDVINVSGDPLLVDKSTVAPDANIQANVVEPLNDALAAAQSTIIATTDVFLEHNADDPNGPRVIRQRETNLGNLVADAFVWAVEQEGSGLTAGNTLIGLTNAGGIRDNLDDQATGEPGRGEISLGEAQGVLPFSNTMAVIGDVDVDTLVGFLENAVSLVETDNGRFAQISGFEFDYNPDAAAGDRVRAVRFEDGTVLWTEAGGSEFSGLFDIATNSFVSAGGDGYAVGSLPVTLLQTAYADALIAYLISPNGLDGFVSAADYPLAGIGRINAVPLPAAAWLLMGGLGAVLGLGRRRAA